MDADKYEALSFDCYGTLVDWEGGIVSGLRPVLRAHGVEASDDEILDLHAGTEHRLQSASEEGGYVKYRDVLGEEVREAGRRWGFEPSPSEVEALPDSVRYWLPFPDTVSALRVLKSRYELAIISNVDDGLFALTARYLEVEFDYIITAEQAGTYKPSLSNFELALKRMGAAPERILHVAESLFHDHVPAKKLGLDTAWVHRRAVKGLRGNPPGGGRLRHRGARPRCRWSSPSGSAGGQPGYVSSHSASSSSFRLEPEGRRRGLRKRISLLVMGK